MTLIEVIIALAVVGLATSLVVGGVSYATRASMRTTAFEITGAVKYAYDRSIMERRIHRIGFDMDRGQWWLDETEDRFGLREQRLEGDRGDPTATDDDDELDVDDDDDPEVIKALRGGRAAEFKPIVGQEERNQLDPDVRFTRVWTGHQEEPFRSGVGFLHFFPGGFTEPAQIELEQAGEYMTLKVSPLTGRVRMYKKRLEDPDVEDVRGEDEGDD